MATANVSAFLRRLTRGMVAETLADQSDRQLVERLLAGRDEAAFETIVRRHGAMVYRVCWRVLQQEQDTEDAFQATFLILAQQLRTVRRHASLASWLHGIAHRVALKARAQAATRRRHEQKAATEKFSPEKVPWRELRAVLDAELQQLPEKWRLPLILCYLEGRTQDEAAKQLGSSERTLRRRLEEARAALGRRLTGRGVAWPAALSAVLLSDCVAPAALAPRLVGSTVEAAARIATGPAALTAAVSANVAALTEGVLKTMFTCKLKIAMAALVLLATLAVGAGGLLYQTQAAGPQQPPKGYPKSEPVKAPPGIPAVRGGDKPQARPKPVVVKGGACLRQVTWSADGKTVVTLGQTAEVVEVKDSDGNNPMKVTVPHSTIKLWDIRTGKEERHLGEEKDTFAGPLVFSHDKQTVAIPATKVFDREKGALVRKRETEVRLMNAKTWELKSRFTADEFGITWGLILALSPDGKRLAVGGFASGGTKVPQPGDEVPAQDYLKLWDVEKGKAIQWTPKKPKTGEQVFKRMTCLAFSPDGKLIAVGEEGRVRLFNAQTGEPRAVLDGPINPSLGIVFSPDGKTILTGSQDNEVKLWDVAEGKLRRVLKGNKGPVLAAAFSPDRTLLATGGTFEQEKDKWQSEVILWDAKTGDMKQTLRSDLSVPVLSLAFSFDGKTLAVAGGLTGDAKDGGKTSGEMRLIPLE